MKRKTFLIMAVFVLAGCAGASVFVKQTPVIGPDGNKTYLLTNETHQYPGGREYAQEGLTKYTKNLCPNGYELINEEFTKINNPFGVYMGREEVIWQVRCKTSDQPKT